MSVIIRLQNLPWSANAMDIRTFFRGLSIPEGGVHIVGGEQGDAFIAFSTDEDARQAMQNDGGRIKEVQVKLLLSSRSEMHKVIETARQSVSFLQLAQPAASVQPPALPPSIGGLLAHGLNKIPPMLPATFPPLHVALDSSPVRVVDALSGDSDREKDAKRTRDGKGVDRKSLRSRSESKDRDKKGRDRDRKDKRERSRSRDRSRERDRRRRDRSRSRDRRDRKRDRKERSRDRERSKEIGDPRLQRRDDRKAEASGDDPADGSRSPPRALRGFGAKSKEGLLGDFPRGAPDEPAAAGAAQTGPAGPPFLRGSAWPPDPSAGGPPAEVAAGGLPQGARGNGVDGGARQTRFSDGADRLHRLRELGERRNPNAFQTPDGAFVPRGVGPRPPFRDPGFPPGGPRAPARGFPDGAPPMRHPDPRHRFNGGPVGGFCVRVQNLLTSTGYGDIRRFFAGNFISNQGLKIINNENGKRSGTAFVKFFKSEGKQNALRKNGELLKGRPVMISHLEDEEFEGAVDSYRPNRESEDSGEEADPRRGPAVAEGGEGEERIENFKVLVLEDLPAFAKEHDIMKMFSDYSLLSIVLVVTKDVRKQYVAYVQFVNADDAEAALNDKSKHLIGHKAIKASPCSEAAFEAVRGDRNGVADDASERGPADFERDGGSPAAPRDPRQRRCDGDAGDPSGQRGPFRALGQVHPRFQWRGGDPDPPGPPGPPGRRGDGEGPFLPRRPLPMQPDFGPPALDCTFLRGLPLRTTDRDILEFFSDVRVIPTKIHLMLTVHGQPSGDCFCEFIDSDEAAVAATKRGAKLGGGAIAVELVTKQVVDEARGVAPAEKGYGSRGGFRGRGFPPRGGPGRRMRGGPGPHHGGGRGGGNRFAGPAPEPPYGPSESAGAEGFGAPGCVLSLENVPFRAGVDEILKFFGDFNVTQNDIIRRFNEKGHPTGDVRVNLRLPAEAQRALQQLNKRCIRDRNISISML